MDGSDTELRRCQACGGSIGPEEPYTAWLFHYHAGCLVNEAGVNAD